MTGPFATPPAIELRGVSRWFGNVVAVNDISFELRPGIVGLLGPNGAGKSTLLHMMSGLLRPSAGTVRIDGKDPWRNPGVYRDLGIVDSRDGVYGFMTGEEFLSLNARLHRLEDIGGAVETALARTGLEDVAGRPAGGYSKGMRQRLRVAAALVHDPAILLLDEPFNGADPAQRLHLMDLLEELAEHGRTVVVSSHILEEVERLAGRVLVILAGRLAAAGDFREIRKLMTDRPYSIVIRSGDDRVLGASLVSNPTVFALELRDSDMLVRTADLGAFSYALPRLARDAGVSLLEVRPTDESLESVFSYLVTR